MKNDTVAAISIYLDRKKTRTYVGKLTMGIEKEKITFYFEYDLKYLKRKYAIPLGPELPLLAKHYKSTSLFPSFQDRIPSRENPAYADYCKEAGILEQEQNPMILLSTIGKRGPSSFIFEPDLEEQFSADDLKKYRETLGLTIREFADLFKISAGHLQRIESKRFSGKDILKRIEMYVKFPFVALEEIKNSGKTIHTEKYQKIFNLLLSGRGKNKTSRELGSWSDTLTMEEVDRTLDVIEKLKTVDWAKNFLESKNIKQSISCVEGYELTVVKMNKKPAISELNKKNIPMIIKTSKGQIWVYGKDVIGEPQLTELDKKKCNLDFSSAPYKLVVPMAPSRPEIYFTLNGKHHTHFNSAEVVNIKSSFFEIRFACAIHAAKLEAEYEFKTGVNKKSVDFKIVGSKTRNNFLIELTSLRDSEAVKEGTYEIDNFFAFNNQSAEKNGNAVEERDIIKVQNAILEKTRKFLKIKAGFYHLVVVDMRGFSIGISDEIDYHHIAYGGKNLDDPYKRHFKKDSDQNLVRGVFEESYPDETVRNKIHALGFISEKNYTENEIKNRTILLINPTLNLQDSEKKMLEKLFEEW